MKLAITGLLWVFCAGIAWAQPANDALANRQVLRGTDFNLDATVSGATLEEGEPHEFPDERSVWYSWTPPSDGVVFIGGYGPCPGTFCPPMIGAFLGDDFSNLTVVTNDLLRAADPTEGQARFEVKFGVEYLIRVARSGEGAFTIELRFENFWMRSPAFGAELDVNEEVVLKMSPVPTALQGAFTHLILQTFSGSLREVVEGPQFEARLQDLRPGWYRIEVVATNENGKATHRFTGTEFTVSAKNGQASLGVPEDGSFPQFLTITGTYGTHYALETSDDLVTWRELWKDWLVETPVLVKDWEIAGPGSHQAGFPPVEKQRRFYRLRILY